MKKQGRQSLGRWGEEIAAAYLAAQGYQILERNLRTPYGEIDLIARQGRMIVFCEVKARATDTLGPPEISIGQRKQNRILACASYYIQQHADEAVDWRVDVIAVESQRAELQPRITHFENAFS